MTLTILSVAYPLTSVGPDAVGGAEQILTYLDAALVRAGHKSIVVACEGSKTSGTLFTISVSGSSLAETLESTDAQQRAVIKHILGEYPVDVVHMHGLRTGFLVHDEREMADAIEAVGSLDPQVCFEAARKRFPLERMIER